MLLLQMTVIDGVPDYMAFTVSANSVGKFRLCTTLRQHSYFGAGDCWGGGGEGEERVVRPLRAAETKGWQN
jgi:hypothetical protein